MALHRNRLLRGSVVVTELGVSQRAIACSLAKLVDTPVSLGWLQAASLPGVVGECELLLGARAEGLAGARVGRAGRRAEPEPQDADSRNCWR